MSKIKIFSLGGLNENGKNMYIVEVDEDIFVFDAGLKFGMEKMLGVDYILPDYEYIIQNIKRVKGLFLTHGHESNAGATADIMKDIPELKVYGTKFTLEVVKADLKENNLPSDKLIEMKPHTKINFGKNSVFSVSVTHSIPESVAYVLYTEDGAIVYTGDYVFDSTMMGHYGSDIGKLAYVGKQGVLCLLSESIYADKEGHTSPSNRADKFIAEVFNKAPGRIISTLHPAHIYRAQEILRQVERSHKKLIIMGKSLQELIFRSIEMGYISFDRNYLGDLTNVNDNNAVIMISDEKEKPFMNLERIIKGFDKYIKNKDNDTIFITEPAYEGIELRQAMIMDDIARLGVEAIALSSKHLSHHASREDLMLMLNLMNPKYYFPVRGEYRHQVKNAEIAEALGMPKENILLKENGDVVLIENGQLQETKEKVAIDEILIDGKSSEDVGELVLKDRQMLGENGIVIVSCTLSKTTKKILSGPEILTRGFIFVKENAELIAETERLSLEIIDKNIEVDNKKVDYNSIKNEVREVLGKFYYRELESKPMIITVIQEV